jgi:nucleoside-diphosphate-sugar epimerase
MNSLIIGNTSQLSPYFPTEYERISSRNIVLSKYKNSYYDRIYITFAEQRLNEIKEFKPYFDINVDLTLKIINFFKYRSNAIIVYGSCELWNMYNGAINIQDKFNYDLNCSYTGYCTSKHVMIEKIKSLNEKNIFVLHPFNFNSPYRKPGYLFYKIFDSIINRKKIEIGDTYFYRDIVHPKYVVERSIKCDCDEIVGSGRLIFVNDLIRDLYKSNSLDYDEYVSENLVNSNPKKPLYLKSSKILYNNLLNDTFEDIELFKKIS